MPVMVESPTPRRRAMWPLGAPLLTHIFAELRHGQIDGQPGLVLGRPHVLEEQPGTVQDAFDELNAIVHERDCLFSTIRPVRSNSSCGTNDHSGTLPALRKGAKVCGVGSDARRWRQQPHRFARSPLRGYSNKKKLKKRGAPADADRHSTSISSGNPEGSERSDAGSGDYLRISVLRSPARTTVMLVGWPGGRREAICSRSATDSGRAALTRPPGCSPLARASLHHLKPAPRPGPSLPS